MSWRKECDKDGKLSIGNDYMPVDKNQRYNRNVVPIPESQWKWPDYKTQSEAKTPEQWKASGSGSSGGWNRSHDQTKQPSYMSYKRDDPSGSQKDDPTKRRKMFGN